jgi:hypothetical protein
MKLLPLVYKRMYDSVKLDLDDRRYKTQRRKDSKGRKVFICSPQRRKVRGDPLGATQYAVRNFLTYHTSRITHHPVVLPVGSGVWYILVHLQLGKERDEQQKVKTEAENAWAEQAH